LFFYLNQTYMQNNDHNSSSRRGFLGKLATGAAALGAASIISPLSAAANTSGATHNFIDADAWFDQVKGKHRIVFDVTEPHGIFPFAWPRIFLVTNGATGSTEKDCGVVVILRHDAIAYTMQDSLWAKYKFGEVFKADDPATKAPSVRNPFAKPKPGEYKVPGFGPVPIGINELQASGVMFCVCNAALTVYSAAIAEGMGLKAEDVYKEWVAGLLPGIQIVPSGVWAVGRAQEHGCQYCFVG
jgi:intracellular sulfur oxidation DsrE/DsrF family protein